MEERHPVSLNDEEQGRPLLNRALSMIPASDNNNGMRRPDKQGNPLGETNMMNGFQSESCLLEQLRVSDNWRHLMAVEQSGQVKLNLKEQFSARL